MSSPRLLDQFDICKSIGSDLKCIVKSFYVFNDWNQRKNVLFTTIDDKVFAFGYNSESMCGLGHDMVVNEPQRLDKHLVT